MFISRVPQSEVLFQKTTNAFKKFGSRSRLLSLSSDMSVFQRARSETISNFSPRTTNVDAESVDNEKHGATAEPAISAPRANESTPERHVFPHQPRSRGSSADSDVHWHDALKSVPNSAVKSLPDESQEISIRRPRMMHRSSSHSAASFSLGTITAASPRRLAKTAHLHELKTRNTNTFSSESQPPLDNVTNLTHSPSRGRRSFRQKKLSKLTPRTNILKELPPTEESQGTADVRAVVTGHESDGWVDTDVGSDAGQERAQVIEFSPTKSSSLERSIFLSLPPRPLQNGDPSIQNQ